MDLKIKKKIRECFCYGFPIIDLLAVEVKFTEGRINSNSGLMNDPRWYQHTATIQDGNSGGPLLTNMVI